MTATTGKLLSPSTAHWVSLLVTLLTFALATASCSTANVGTAAGVSTLRTYVGSLTASSTSVQAPLVAFMVAPKDDGTLDLRAYMCDGIDSGELLWVRGPALPAGDTYAFDLTSALGYQVTGTISPNDIAGTITNTTVVGAVPIAFSAERAAEGSGIFDLAASADGSISGTSLTGDSLQLTRAAAKASQEGGQTYSGSIVTTDGENIGVELVDLSTLPSEVLEDAGFATGLAVGQQGLTAATYRAIVLLKDGGFTVFGRVLLPGTGVNGVAPQFGTSRVALTSRLSGKL